MTGQPINQEEPVVPQSGTSAEQGDSEHKTNSESESSTLLPKIINFDTLARCGDEIWIENNGQIYRLRRTRQGKLILTK